MARWGSSENVYEKSTIAEKVKEEENKTHSRRRMAGKGSIGIDVVRKCVYVESDINPNGWAYPK